MKTTTNYQLSQWDPGDRLLRTDFNGDNGKIDAAIKAVQDAATAAIAKVAADAAAANCYTKLFETTTTAAASQIDIDVSGISFKKYYKIELFINVPGGGNGFKVRVDRSTNYTALFMNGEGGGTASAVEDLAVFYAGTIGLLLFYPPISGANVGCVLITRDSMNYIGQQRQSASCSWSGLAQFNLISSSFPAGTKICICGVKK